MRDRKDKDCVLLVITDEDDWSDEGRHLVLLQEKLNAYLAFIESGQIAKWIANQGDGAVSSTAPVRVEIISRFPVPPPGMHFVGQAIEFFKSAGLVLTQRARLDDSSPAP